MKESIYKNYDELPLFLNAKTVAEVLGETGCISKINDNLYEGRYSPRLPDGKRISKNVYAKTIKACETKLAELIETMKAKIKTKKFNSIKNQHGISPCCNF